MKETPKLPHKPKLLVLELWGLGDLAMATPFLQAACQKFDVTLVAKNYAHDLQARFWPQVKVITWNAPWTAFQKKYAWWRWHWRSLIQLIAQLKRAEFDFAVSARWDPRDHFFLWLVNADQRLGFPRLGSQTFLTSPQERVSGMHRYLHWRALGNALGLDLPEQTKLILPRSSQTETILVHTGASQPTRIWPLENFRLLVDQLRQQNFSVQVACDSAQRQWWLRHNEPNVLTAGNVTELIKLCDGAAKFIGNDSGPGHVAAICGLPTLTIFGPSSPEEYGPIHPQAEAIYGKACTFKPCKDSCHFKTPFCLYDVTVPEVMAQTGKFLQNVTG